MLVGFGQEVCKPIGPRCDLCDLGNARLCPSRRTVVPSSPTKRKVKVEVGVKVEEEEGKPKIEIGVEVKEEEMETTRIDQEGERVREVVVKEEETLRLEIA